MDDTQQKALESNFKKSEKSGTGNDFPGRWSASHVHVA